MEENEALERRMARLEENLFFQDRLLDDLNTVLLAQQRQLDAVERSIKQLAGQVKELRLLMEEGSGPANVPPPHYL